MLQKFGPRFDTRVRRGLRNDDGGGGGRLESWNRMPHMAGGMGKRERWVFGVLLAALCRQEVL